LPDGAVSRCWRVSLAVRLGIGVAILATAPIALISAMQDDHPISDPLTAIVMYAAFWWFGIVRPAVWLSPDELVVRNPLWTHRIARENVVSAKPGSFGAVISRRDGRPCRALALYKPKIAVEDRTDRAVRLINCWAQTLRSSNQGEVPDSLYAETQERRPRRRVGDIAVAAGLAIAFTIPAILLAWTRHPSWLFPVASLAMVIALVPFALTRQPRDAFRRDR
jgi:hypothetical protein